MATNECISKTQFKYVCERIDAICEKARAAKKKELTIREKHRVTDDEAAEIFENCGCEKLKVKNSYYLRCALDFSFYENELEYDEEAYRKFCETILAEATDFKDRAVLCGGGDVLEGLKDFERKYL